MDTQNSGPKNNIYDILKTLGSLKDSNKGIERKKMLCKEALDEYKEEIKIIVEHLMGSSDLSEVDLDFLIFLCELLGIDITTLLQGKLKKNQKEKEIKEVNEKQEKEVIKKLVIYAMYKLISPHKIAGQTLLEDFIKDLRQHGVHHSLIKHIDLTLGVHGIMLKDEHITKNQNTATKSRFDTMQPVTTENLSSKIQIKKSPSSLVEKLMNEIKSGAKGRGI